MGFTREQFDTISNIYNNRRVANQFEHDRRVNEVYDEAPEIEELDGQISSISAAAARLALEGKRDNINTLREDIEVIHEQKKALLLSHGFSANYLDPIFDCEKCHDTGFIEGKPCDCLRPIVSNILYNRSELNKVLEKENFDTFNFDYYSEDFIDEVSGESALDNIEKVVDYCRYYIKHFNDSKDNLLFYGNAGTGKTFLVNCIVKELIDKSQSVIYLSAVQFFDLLADYAFRRKESSVYRNISMNELLGCDLLVIDDLGSEMKNTFTNSALFDCLNERLIHQKPTIISTNLSFRELQENYDERISSRVLGNFKRFSIFGDDIRIKKTLSY